MFRSQRGLVALPLGLTLARIFGTKRVASEDGVTVTSYEFRGRQYVTEVRQTHEASTMDTDLRIDLAVADGKLVVSLFSGQTLLSKAWLSIDHIISQRQSRPPHTSEKET